MIDLTIQNQRGKVSRDYIYVYVSYGGFHQNRTVSHAKDKRACVCACVCVCVLMFISGLVWSAIPLDIKPSRPLGRCGNKAGPYPHSLCRDRFGSEAKESPYAFMVVT